MLKNIFATTQLLILDCLSMSSTSTLNKRFVHLSIVKVRPSVPRHLVSWPMGELTKCSLVPANFRPLINISNIFKCCCAIFHVCNYAVKVD